MRSGVFPPILLSGLFGVILLLHFTARATNNASQLEMTPAQISASIPLGSVADVTLELRNSGTAPVNAVIYEAYATGTQAHDQSARSASPAAAQPLRVALPRQAERVDPRIISELAASPDGTTTALIFLGDQADLSSATTITDWDRRGEYVYRTLVEHAERTQAPLRRLLHARGAPFRPYWIVNAIAVEADRDLIDQLVARQEVALIRANQSYAIDEPESSLSEQSNWHITQVGADRVWNTFGAQGQGIVVANIDTGVAYSHTALLPRYRGYRSNGSLQHDYNWFDATGLNPQAPADPTTIGHGTHTMGLMVGAATNSGPAIGLAPQSRWIAARGCTASRCSDSWLITAAEWTLAPTDRQGAHPRPDLRPHVVNNSWGGLANDRWYAGYVAAWNAAGIFTTFAAGNSGNQGCGSVISPGDYSESFAVGATDVADTIASFSSRGPTADSRLKPDISAPGVDVVSAIPGNRYRAMSGTSMATPQVAGIAALLWSANPELVGDIERTRAIIRETALPVPSSECSGTDEVVPNNAYGWGRVDAYAAVASARLDVPWLTAPQNVTLAGGTTATVPITLDGRVVSRPGAYVARLLIGSDRADSLQAVTVTLTVEDSPDAVTLRGHLRDHRTGDEVVGRLAVAGRPLTTDTSGAYTVTVLPGTYEITAGAYGYLGTRATLSLSRSTTYDWQLTRDAPHMVLTAPPLSSTLDFGERRSIPITISNAGPQPLSLALSIPTLEYSSEQHAVESAAAPWYDLSSSDPLPLADDQIYTDTIPLGFSMPIYGRYYDRFYLSSNGWISFTQPRYANPTAYCFPINVMPNLAFAPLWTDLDPSQGGRVRAAQVLSDTFVVSFEGVPHWDREPGPQVPTYTFQLVLHRSGRIHYQYKELGSLPHAYTVGMQHSASSGQSLHCSQRSRQRPVEGMAYEVEGQPQPAIWLGAQPTTLTLAAGATQVVTTELRGLAHKPWRTQPYSAAIDIVSNDPLLPTLRLSANLVVRAPPYQITLAVTAR